MTQSIKRSFVVPPNTIKSRMNPILWVVKLTSKSDITVRERIALINKEMIDRLDLAAEKHPKKSASDFLIPMELRGIRQTLALLCQVLDDKL